MRPGFTDDDWLDEIDVRSRRGAVKKPALSRAKTLPPQEGNGTVMELFPNESAVRLDASGRSSICKYRMSTLAFGAAQKERSPVCVGDRVRVEGQVIIGRCERRNRLIRPAPNARDPLLHVMAANLDCVVVVAAAREPEFSGGIVDRFLVAASAQKIPQILCVNKEDLIQPRESQAPWSHYAAAGIAIVETSALMDHGTALLLELLRGKVAVFCGHSGVGKTSLLRRLSGNESYGRTGAVSRANDKGRHTTSGAVFIAGPGGSGFIDTPGVMNFGLIGVAPGELLSHFPELFAAAAKCAKGCSHDEEATCRLRALPRFDSYRAIKRSIENAQAFKESPRAQDEF